MAPTIATKRSTGPERADAIMEPEHSPAAVLFDAIGADYETAFADLPGQLAAIDWLLANLKPGSTVLDIGSGTGRPTAHTLAAAGHHVDGIDVSATMVELARTRVPAARFRLADVRALPDDAGPWDAVCAFFAFLQLSRAELDDVLSRLGDRLTPGGLLAFATIPADVEDFETELMGHRVRATSYPTDVLLARLTAAGLEIIDHVESVFSPNHPSAHPEPHVFIRARKPLGG
jgi:SAM-dependent methyltransferase